MKKSIVIALMVVFSVFAAGVAFAVINPDGTLLVNTDAKVWPVKKLKKPELKEKAKGPVTFNHKKHGEPDKCKTCHHTEDLKSDAKTAKTCFECHGPELKTVDGKAQIDSYAVIHDKKVGKCIPCHKEAVAKDATVKAPTKCKECHGGADEE